MEFKSLKNIETSFRQIRLMAQNILAKIEDNKILLAPMFNITKNITFNIIVKPPDITLPTE